MTLVANLIAPPALATPMLPRRVNRPPEGDNALSGVTQFPTEVEAAAQYDIQRQPLVHSRVKSSYSVQEFLRAIAAASAPFRNLGKMVGEAYEAASGNEMDPPTRVAVQRVGSVVDAATGLIPSVQIARLPGRVADVGADALDGKLPDASKVTDLLQFGDPRSFGSQVPAPHETPPVQPVLLRRAPVFEAAPVDDVDPDLPAASPMDADPPAFPPETAVAKVADSRDPVAVAEGLDTPNADDALGTHDGRGIEGEQDHLRGYEQTLPRDRMPAESHRQLTMLDGRHYLAGKAGHYHVTPGQHADHWLVNGPRGTRAQVPVTYDAQTGTWRAGAPLRLCGGGCGPSRESTPDSVAMSKSAVGDAIRHIADREVRDGIQQAYSDLAHLHLMRTNREDLRPLRDNSIVEHRRVLVPQLMRLDPYSTLFEQQREAALITTIHYDNYLENNLLDLSPEAFCQENAEILFHYLLTRGVPSNNVRMITVKSQGRPPHVMVLYTESNPFIDLLDLTTPQPPVFGHDDGIPGDMFAGALFLSRQSSVLLDPWSRIKASSFPWANDADEVRSMLEIALADTGRIPDSPYTVSLTRPYPAPREQGSSSSGSSISMRSQGSSAGDYIRPGPSQYDPRGAPPKGGREAHL